MFSFLLSSCGIEEIQEPNPGYYNKNMQRDNAWVCHNPDSDMHGHICNIDCLYPNNVYTFCWYLDAEDCIKPYKLEWQENYCPILYR